LTDSDFIIAYSKMTDLGKVGLI